MRSTSCETPRAAFRSVSACSKRCPSTPSTTSPYIWMSRRYESSAKRGLPVDAASPSTATSFRPRLRIDVHHPRHRDRRARADRDEERVALVAEALARPLLERRDVLVDLVVEPLGDLAAAGHVGAARVGRDREPGRHGNAELRHLGEADPLSAEELATAARVLVEVVDVAHLRGESTLAPRLVRRYTHGRRDQDLLRRSVGIDALGAPRSPSFHGGMSVHRVLVFGAVAAASACVAASLAGSAAPQGQATITVHGRDQELYVRALAAHGPCRLDRSVRRPEPRTTAPHDSPSLESARVS